MYRTARSFACMTLLAVSFTLPAAQGATVQAANYSGLTPGEFMTRWLILGPVPVGDGSAEPTPDDQKKAFDADALAPEQLPAKVTIGGTECKWAPMESQSEICDLGKRLGIRPNAIAYARAQVDMPAETKAILAIGSDDAVKIWLNGRLVHENWAMRGLAKDNDLVPVTFRQGSNDLLLKVQNGAMDWQFCCRMLGADVLAEKLVFAARSDDTAKIQMLLDHGAGINAKVGPGISALHMARIFGKEDAAKLLLEKGADAGMSMPAKEQIADWVIQRVVKGDCPAAVALVARDGKTVYEKGFGYACIESKTPATARTIFRIGSVTKQFTAAAVLKLQEQGKLRIEDKLSKFLPDYPRGDEVTLYHLLTHTSGIHDFTQKPQFEQVVTVGTTPEEMVRGFKDDPYDFNPGERHQYSNSGYFLLGCIVEKVSGKTLGDYLKDTLFTPLGMKDTGMHRRGLALDREAIGYSYVGGKIEKAPDWDMSRAGGAGALYSTVEDLCRWNEALFGGKVISESDLKAAVTPCVLANGQPGNANGGPGYGFGLAMAELEGMKLVGHAGALPGFIGYLVRVPDKNLTVSVLSNCVPLYPDLLPPDLAHDLAKVYLYEPLAESR